jgi:hypothetical protein
MPMQPPNDVTSGILGMLGPHKTNKNWAGSEEIIS